MRQRYEIEAPTYDHPKRDKPVEVKPRPAQREPRPTPAPQVNFSTVPPSQWKMHDRLENWARWCNSRAGQDVSVGFSLHKSDEWSEREYGAETSVPVDRDDAQRLQKGVSRLPDKHMRAVNWYYLKPVRADERASQLGLSKQGLADCVVEARLMLLNRGV